MYPHQHWGLSLYEATGPFTRRGFHAIRSVETGTPSRRLRPWHPLKILPWHAHQGKWQYKRHRNSILVNRHSAIRSKADNLRNKSFKCPLVMALHLRLYGTTWESWEPWNTYNINSNTPLYALLMISCHYKNHLQKSMPVQVRLVCSSVRSTVHKQEYHICMFIHAPTYPVDHIHFRIDHDSLAKKEQCKELYMTHSFLLQSAAKALYSDRAVLTFISPCASNRVCILLILPQRSLLYKIDASYIIHFTLSIILWKSIRTKTYIRI